VRIRSSTCSWGLARAGRRGTGSRRGTAGQGAGSGTARWGPRSSTLYPGTPTMTTRPAPVSSLRRRRRRPLGLRERDREQRAISECWASLKYHHNIGFLSFTIITTVQRFVSHLPTTNHTEDVDRIELPL
jgi:hypothetical protein